MTSLSTAPSGRNARPAAPARPEPTGTRQLDEMVARLREGASAFVRLSLSDRIALARSMQAGYLRIASRSVEAGPRSQGNCNGQSGGRGGVGRRPWPVVRQLRLVIESLQSIQRTGTTPIGHLGRNADGRLTVRVFPTNRIDGVLFSGITVDVHMLPGVTEDALDATRASFYQGQKHDGRVVLVLGAGNITSIPPMDVITKLFNQASVCLLKMNPLNAYAGPFIEAAFAEAIARGFLAVAYGGAEEGAYLVQHRGIDEIHLTPGSAATYDHIVWGPPGPEREAGRREPAGGDQAGDGGVGQRLAGAGGPLPIQRKGAGVPGPRTSLGPWCTTRRSSATRRRCWSPLRPGVSGRRCSTP